MTNCPDKIVCSGVKHISISDHSLVYAYRKLSGGNNTNAHDVITYRDFKGFNLDNFRKDLSKVDWSSICSASDINIIWEAWKTNFLKIVDSHAPLRSKRTKCKKSRWISSHLKDLMHERDKLKKTATKSKNPAEWCSYPPNFVTKSIEKAFDNEMLSVICGLSIFSVVERPVFQKL